MDLPNIEMTIKKAIYKIIIFKAERKEWSSWINLLTYFIFIHLYERFFYTSVNVKSNNWIKLTHANLSNEMKKKFFSNIKELINYA